MSAHPHEHHNHDSHEDHNHEIPKDFSYPLLIAIALNLTFVIIEIIYGKSSNSTALIADATHNFGDVLGLVLGFVAIKLSTRLPDAKYTFGFKSTTILATLFNSIVLFLVTGAILWEAFQKLLNPAPVQGGTVIIVALIGVLINGLSAFLLSKGNGDLNIKSAFAHLASDAVISFGAALAGVIILITGFVYVDSIVSLIIGFVIIKSTFNLLLESLNLSLQSVPKGINITQIRDYLEKLDGVIEVHDLHIWAIGTADNSLTCHLVVKDNSISIDLIKICHHLEHDFGINHPTIQVETMNQYELCELRPANVI